MSTKLEKQLLEAGEDDELDVLNPNEEDISLWHKIKDHHVRIKKGRSKIKASDVLLFSHDLHLNNCLVGAEIEDLHEDHRIDKISQDDDLQHNEGAGDVEQALLERKNKKNPGRPRKNAKDEDATEKDDSLGDDSGDTVADGFGEPSPLLVEENPHTEENH